jgi:hypothetical protein
MRLSEFAGVTLPDAQAVSDLTRVAEREKLKPVGLPMGEYDLYGSESPMGAQTYRADFAMTAVTQAMVDALMAKEGTRGTLKQLMRDASTRQVDAKLLKVAQGVTVADKHGGIERLSCTFEADPGWYASALTTVNFTTTAAVELSGANVHAGNLRAVRYLVLTITTALAGVTNITVLNTGGLNPTLQYTQATSGTLVIDCGAHTVYEGSTNRMAKISRPYTQVPLLWVDPGAAWVTFDRSLSGSVAFRSAWK